MKIIYVACTILFLPVPYTFAYSMGKIKAPQYIVLAYLRSFSKQGIRDGRCIAWWQSA